MQTHQEKFTWLITVDDEKVKLTTENGHYWTFPLSEIPHHLAVLLTVEMKAKQIFIDSLCTTLDARRNETSQDTHAAYFELKKKPDQV